MNSSLLFNIKFSADASINTFWFVVLGMWKDIFTKVKEIKNKKGLSFANLLYEH